MEFHWAALLLFNEGKHIRSNPIIIFQGGSGRESPDINYIQTQTYSAASLHLYIYII